MPWLHKHRPRRLLVMVALCPKSIWWVLKNRCEFRKRSLLIFTFHHYSFYSNKPNKQMQRKMREKLGKLRKKTQNKKTLSQTRFSTRLHEQVTKRIITKHPLLFFVRKTHMQQLISKQNVNSFSFWLYFENKKTFSQYF